VPYVKDGNMIKFWRYLLMKKRSMAGVCNENVIIWTNYEKEKAIKIIKMNQI
jgi:hypothetical protein